MSVYNIQMKNKNIFIDIALIQNSLCYQQILQQQQTIKKNSNTYDSFWAISNKYIYIQYINEYK